MYSGAIYFGTAANGENPIVGSGSGDFTGSYQNNNQGVIHGFIRDLVGPGGNNGSPFTGPVNVPDFAEFDVAGGVIQFDLTDIPAGIGTPAACGSDAIGNLCTIPNSPFTLLQAASDEVTISLSLNGIAYFPPPSTGYSTALSIFSTQTVPGTITGILADVAPGGSGFKHTYSATIAATPVPEPASMLLMGIGLLGAGLIARKRISRA